MIIAPYALQYLRTMAASSASPLRRGLLNQLVQDAWDGAVYVRGHVSQQLSDVLVEMDRTIYGYYCCSYELVPRSMTVSAFGLFPGSINWVDWALIAATIESCCQAQAQIERVEPDSVVVPAPARASLLLTAFEGEYEPLFIFPNDLTPLQGMVLLNRAFVNGQGAAENMLVRRHEAIH